MSTALHITCLISSHVICICVVQIASYNIHVMKVDVILSESDIQCTCTNVMW